MKLALTPDSRWDLDVVDLVDATRAAGFVGLGCPVGRTGVDVHAAYQAAGLACHEIMALVITDDAKRTIAYAARLADAAATMAAPWVNTVFRATPTPEVARVIARCAALFADAGSGMAVEFSPAGSVPGIKEGLGVVELAGAGAGLLIDTWHFSVGPSTWEDLEGLSAEAIAYIQFTDAPELSSDDLLTETMERRVMPGEGIFELDRFATVLRGNGFDGYVSVEVLNSQLRKLPVPTFLETAFGASARYWS